MPQLLSCVFLFAVLSPLALCSGQPAQTTPAPPYTEKFIPVDKDVSLQILDWGGAGRPLLLLAGLGFDAHEYDDFAPTLARQYHVYALTRRGFGRSSAPVPGCDNYSAGRLGDDVLAVMDALHLDRPILIGHSIAGEELSSVGSRYPQRVAGLIYLDAGYIYAFYDDSAAQGPWTFDAAALSRELSRLGTPAALAEKQKQTQHLLLVTLPRFERDLQDFQKQLQSVDGGGPFTQPITPQVQINAAIIRGMEVLATGGCLPGRQSSGARCPHRECQPFRLPLEPGRSPSRHQRLHRYAALSTICRPVAPFLPHVSRFPRAHPAVPPVPAGQSSSSSKESRVSLMVCATSSIEVC